MSFVLIKFKQKLANLKEGVNNLGPYSLVVAQDGTFALKFSKEIIEVIFFFYFANKNRKVVMMFFTVKMRRN